MLNFLIWFRSYNHSHLPIVCHLLLLLIPVIVVSSLTLRSSVKPSIRPSVRPVTSLPVLPPSLCLLPFHPFTRPSPPFRFRLPGENYQWHIKITRNLHVQAADTCVCVCLTCGIGSIRNHHRSKNKGQWLTADAVTLNQECDCEIWRERGIFFTSATSCFFLSLLFFVRCLFYLFLRENDPVISGNCSLSAILASTSYLIDEFTQSLLQCVTVTLTEWLFNTISLLLLEYEQKLCVFFTLQTNPKFLFNYTRRHLKLLKKSFFLQSGNQFSETLALNHAEHKLIHGAGYESQTSSSRSTNRWKPKYQFRQLQADDWEEWWQQQADRKWKILL